MARMFWSLRAETGTFASICSFFKRVFFVSPFSFGVFAKFFCLVAEKVEEKKWRKVEFCLFRNWVFVCFSIYIYIYFQFWNKFYAPFGCWECGGAGWGRNEVKSCWLLKWVTLFFHNSFFPFSFSKILCSVWLPRNRKKMKESGILFVSKMGFLCFGLIPLFFSFWQNLFV